MSVTIDINCDMGESYGVYRLGMDEEVIPHITSANVACGFHGGDPSVIGKTVELATRYGVGVGAHVSYPDLQGFGRRSVEMPHDELVDLVIYQIGALEAFCRRHGISIQHVKPHGSLNNMADHDPEVADAITEACRVVVPEAMIFVKPGSELKKSAEKKRLSIALEVFADRAYNEDYSLVPRRLPGAVIEDPEAVAERMLQLLKTGKMPTVQGRDISLQAETMCVHGDTPGAVNVLRKLRQSLEEAGVEIRPISARN